MLTFNLDIKTKNYYSNSNKVFTLPKVRSGISQPRIYSQSGPQYSSVHYFPFYNLCLIEKIPCDRNPAPCNSQAHTYRTQPCCNSLYKSHPKSCTIFSVIIFVGKKRYLYTVAIFIDIIPSGAVFAANWVFLTRSDATIIPTPSGTLFLD